MLPPAPPKEEIPLVKPRVNTAACPASSYGRYVWGVQSETRGAAPSIPTLRRPLASLELLAFRLTGGREEYWQRQRQDAEGLQRRLFVSMILGIIICATLLQGRSWP